VCSSDLSLTFPGRVNVNTKYLIDSASNVIELTEANKNLFDVQSIFAKSDVNVALDNANQPSKQKPLNGLKLIYAGGFRYEPIFQNISTPLSLWSNLQFSFLNDIAMDNPDPNSQVTANIPNGLTIGTPTISNPFTSTAAGLEQDDLQITLNTGIIFPVTRNTPYAGEIRQRVSGSITLNVKVSPSGEFVTRFYDNTTGVEPARWTRAGTYENAWLYNLDPSDPLTGPGGLTNRVGAIRIVPGVKVQFANSDNEFSSATYDGGYIQGPDQGWAGYNWNGFVLNGLVRSTPNPPLLVGAEVGIDRLIITSTGTTASFSALAPQNTFVSPGSDLVTYSQPFGNYVIEEDNVWYHENI
jgi:hypothetical protein